MNTNRDTPINRSNGSDNSHNNRSYDTVPINITAFNMHFYQLYNMRGSLGYEGFLHQSGDLNSATYSSVRGHCGLGIF